MVKRPVAPESGETVCPACGAAIKAGASSRRRRVQCPKCREVVQLESPVAKGPEALSAIAESDKQIERARIESLEARVEALEAALRDSMAARTAPAGAPQRKLVWVSSTPGRAPEFSPEQGHALFHNLGGVRSQAITIRTPAGDSAARLHAEWFKSIFERAGWSVCGPEEIDPNSTISGLSLAVPELPVAKEAAATFLALKAAGFEAVPILDSAPKVLASQRSSMALTLSPVKAA